MDNTSPTLKPEYIQALNTAASLLQKAPESEEDVYQTFSEQIHLLGLRGGIALLDENGENFVFKTVAQSKLTQTLKKLEKLFKLQAKGFSIAVDQVDIYRQVLTTGKALYTPNTKQVISQMLPDSASGLVKRAVEVFGNHGAIYCPLMSKDKVIGVLNIAGSDLKEEDLPNIKAFANYLSIAIVNARLMDELKESKQNYKSLFVNLPIGLYRITPEGRFIMANPVFLEMFHVQDYQFLHGKMLSSQNIQPLHDRAEVIEQLKQDGEIIGLETAWETPDGQRVYYKENMKSSYDKDGKLLYFEGTIEDITEKKETELQIKKQLQEMRLLNQIAAAGASAENPEELIARVTETIAENLYTHHFGIALWDEDSHGLVVHDSYRGLSATHQNKIFAPGEGIIGQVYQTGVPIYIPDVREHPGYLTTNPDLRSELCVPIKTRDQVLGVLNAEHVELDAFTPQDEMLFKIIADQLAISLERAQFINEIKNQAHQLTLLNEATLTTSRILEPDELINLIAQEIISLFNPDSFQISLFNEKRQRIEIAMAVEKGEINHANIGVKIPFSEGGLTALLRDTGETLQINNLENSPLLVGYKQMEAVMRGSWLGIPFVSGQQIIGALTVQYYEEKEFSKSQTLFLESLAAHAAIAINNGHLFNDIQRRFALNSQLAQLSEGLNQPQKLDEVINTIGESALSLSNAGRGAVFYRGYDETVECLWAKGISEQYIQQVLDRLSEIPTSQVIDTREPVLIPDMHQLPPDQPLRQIALAEGIQSSALWPLVYEGRTIAAFGCYRENPYFCDDDEKEIMMVFARQAAAAIENARLLEAERTRRYEAEALYKTTTTLTSTLDIEKVLSNILVELYRVVDYASASLQLLEGDTVRIVAAEGFQIDPDTYIGFEYPMDNPLFQEMYTLRQPIIIEDVRQDARFSDFLDMGFIRGWIGVPLIVGEKMIGCMTIDSDQPGSFNQSHAQKADAFANQAAIAIETARLFSQTQNRLQVLQSIHTIDQAISSNLDLSITLDVFIDQALNLLEIDVIKMYAYDPDAQIFDLLTYRDMLGISGDSPETLYNQNAVNQAILDREVVMISNQNTPAPIAHPQASCYFVSPLITKGQVRGVVELFSKNNLNPDDEWVDLLKTLSTQAAIAIENNDLISSLQKSNEELVIAYDRTLEGWAYALEMRDKGTIDHSRRVVEMTVKLARKLGIKGTQLANIRRGSLLHDIGKMALPDSVLLKRGPLSKEEEHMMKTHPKLAFDMLSSIPYLKPALDIPLYHHEKWDGSGYPHGLKGEEIPLPARIFAVVDVWDAVSYDRPYRHAWAQKETIEYIRTQAGTHFDPAIVDAFLEMIR